jgi:DNA polymerase-4
MSAPLIAHVDLDAFYASVEARRRPEQADGEGPLIVGGSGPRGVVLSAGYPAREYGVHAGMPVSRARRLCPDAVVLPPNHDEYALASAGVLELLRSLVRAVEPAGLDEAYLDLSASGIRTPPTEFADRIRAAVREEQGLTCSIGIGPSKLVAKLAAKSAKPDGRRLVRSAGVRAFLRPLPARELPGVGGRTAELLDRYGLRTVADLADTPAPTLRQLLGQAAGTRLSRFARGIDERPVAVPAREEDDGSGSRSVGAEHTFPADTDDPEVISRTLLALAGESAARLREAGLAARTVILKVRLSTPHAADGVRVVTRSRTLPAPVDLSREVHWTAMDLYRRLGLVRPRVRLVGVRLEGLGPDGPRQLTLDGHLPSDLRPDDPRPGGGGAAEWGRVERTVDRLARRFGPEAVRPAALLADPGRRQRPPAKGPPTV